MSGAVGQKAAIALDMLPMLRVEAKERQKQSGVDYGRGGKVPLNAEEPLLKREESAETADSPLPSSEPLLIRRSAVVTTNDPDHRPTGSHHHQPGP